MSDDRTPAGSGPHHQRARSTPLAAFAGLFAAALSSIPTARVSKRRGAWGYDHRRQRRNHRSGRPIRKPLGYRLVALPQRLAEGLPVSHNELRHALAFWGLHDATTRAQLTDAKQRAGFRA